MRLCACGWVGGGVSACERVTEKLIIGGSDYRSVRAGTQVCVGDR